MVNLDDGAGSRAQIRRRRNTARSRSGEVAQTIIDIAQEKQVDAVVVGKRGAGRVPGALLGSVSQKLVDSFACAVDRRSMSRQRIRRHRYLTLMLASHY